MATSSRDGILSGALGIIRDGGTVSLESAATAAGLTKPGLMYHFPTKEALMLGLVDHVADVWLTEMTERLSVPVSEAPVRERIAAYFRVCLERDADPADIVMLTDPRLRNELTARWAQRLREWFEGIDDLSPAERGRLAAVRLMADGIWFASATGVNAVAPHERRAILAVATEILSGAQR